MTLKDVTLTFQEVKNNLLTGSTWLRAFFMFLYALLFYKVVLTVIVALVLLQLGSLLIAGRLNQHLLSLGQSLSTYIYQIFAYLTYNSDEKPFPLGLPWPKGSEKPALDDDSGN